MLLCVTLMIDIPTRVVTPSYKYEPLEMKKYFRGTMKYGTYSHSFCKFQKYPWHISSIF